MTKGVHIPKINNDKGNFKQYLKPKRIYIPLIIHNDENISLLVKKGDYVYKGDMVAKSKGDFRTPIHASVSGVVLDFSQMYYLNGNKVGCIVIENDFLEKTREQKNYELNSYSKEDALKRIHANGIIGMSGSGFPTHIKYQNQLNTIIVNAVESDPKTTADYELFTKKCEEILEMTDALLEIFNIKEAIIAIKKTDVKLKELINNHLGTYVKIKLVEVPDYYTAGWEIELVKRIKNIKCQTIPTNKGIVVTGVATMYAIYEALKFDKPLIERIISVSGRKLTSSANVLVKIGTPVDEVIEFLGGYIEGEKVLIANGPLMGQAIESDQIVVSSDLTSISVTEVKEGIENPCLRCGECLLICPVKLSPIFIKDKQGETTNLQAEKCIKCGLCSYICPANINLRSYVLEAKGGQL